MLFKGWIYYAIKEIDESPREDWTVLKASALFHPLLTAGFSEACVGLVNQVPQILASSDTKMVRTQKTFPCQCHPHWRVKFQF